MHAGRPCGAPTLRRAYEWAGTCGAPGVTVVCATLFAAVVGPSH